MQPELLERAKTGGGGGAVLPYMSYIDMCRCEGCDFQAVYMSRILLYDLGMIDMFGHTKKIHKFKCEKDNKNENLVITKFSIFCKRQTTLFRCSANRA